MPACLCAALSTLSLSVCNPFYPVVVDILLLVIVSLVVTRLYETSIVASFSVLVYCGLTLSSIVFNMIDFFKWAFYYLFY